MSTCHARAHSSNQSREGKSCGPDLLRDNGITLFDETVVDATLIAVGGSTENASSTRAPQNGQTSSTGAAVIRAGRRASDRKNGRAQVVGRCAKRLTCQAA